MNGIGLIHRRFAELDPAESDPLQPPPPPRHRRWKTRLQTAVPRPARLQVRLGRQAPEVRRDRRARPPPAPGFPESRCPAELPLEARALREEPRLLHLRRLPGSLVELGLDVVSILLVFPLC